MPAFAAAPGIPHTTLEASSWAITLPPAATISLPPRMPSEPMPVSTNARTAPRHPAEAHPGQHASQNAALPDIDRGGKQRIDGGLAEIDRRPVVESDHDIGAVARDAHMAAALREIDLAGLDDLAIDGFVRRPVARARQVLCKDRRGCVRHMLRD